MGFLRDMLRFLFSSGSTMEGKLDQIASSILIQWDIVWNSRENPPQLWDTYLLLKLGESEPSFKTEGWLWGEGTGDEPEDLWTSLDESTGGSYGILMWSLWLMKHFGPQPPHGSLTSDELRPWLKTILFGFFIQGGFHDAQPGDWQPPTPDMERALSLFLSEQRQWPVAKVVLGPEGGEILGEAFRLVHLRGQSEEQAAQHVADRLGMEKDDARRFFEHIAHIAIARGDLEELGIDIEKWERVS